MRWSHGFSLLVVLSLLTPGAALAGAAATGYEPDLDATVTVVAQPAAAATRAQLPLPGSVLVPAYPLAARRARLDARVRLSGTIDTDGRVVDLRCLGCANDRAGFVASAILAIEHWTYEPAQAADGQAVAVSILFDVHFKR